MYKIFVPKNYSGILINAPHVGDEEILIEHEGKIYKKTIGEKDTELLTIEAAKHVNAAYSIVYIPRTRCDFARDPNDLGKGLKLRRRIKVDNKIIEKFVEIHKDKKCREILEKYHQEIEKIDPKFILDYHGMANKKFDLIIGFGKNYEYIKSKENAEKFKEILMNKLNEKGINIKIGIGKHKFAGSNEYILKSHVKNDRFGALVEFDRKLRYPKTSKETIEIAKTIAEVAKEWISSV